MHTVHARKRLLVLDLDNTLLHVPVYDPLLYALAGVELSKEEFYRALPEAGISLGDDSPLKVFARPYLIDFLNRVENLGYDLALCTTGTREYIDTVLPLCGVSIDRFVSILTREQLKSRGVRTVKDIRQFSSLGYEEEQIVAIDDRKDVYIQRDHVLKIPPFEVKDSSFQEDDELLVMVKRLEHLGDKSLVEARRIHKLEQERENLFWDLAHAAFNSNTYRDLPFQPDFYFKPSFDLEQFPSCEELQELSLDRFLIYKNFGLVGAVERKSDHLLINNFCPEIWTEVSPGVSRTGQGEQEISEWFWFLSSSFLSEVCKDMGYNVHKDDILTLAAVTLKPSHFGGLHVLALSTGLLSENPMSYE